ncbi:Gamma-aminobutyric acid receptor-associated protein-like 2 [Taenia solium]|eukprot:TsM_000064300 transcript=TsM_000064300 gene=TsM_000064300
MLGLLFILAPHFSGRLETRRSLPFKMKFNFKESRSFDERLSDATKIKRKYPDRIPVIVERHPGSQINDLDKHKFLVPNDITVAQFMWIIRKRLQLSPEKALFLFFDDYVPQTSWTMGQLYNERKSDDGFLYAHYSGENSFGGV